MSMMSQLSSQMSKMRATKWVKYVKWAVKWTKWASKAAIYDALSTATPSSSTFLFSISTCTLAKRHRDPVNAFKTHRRIFDAFHYAIDAFLTQLTHFATACTFRLSWWAVLTYDVHFLTFLTVVVSGFFFFLFLRFDPRRPIFDFRNGRRGCRGFFLDVWSPFSIFETVVLSVLGVFEPTTLIFDFWDGRRGCRGYFWTYEAPFQYLRRSSYLFWAFLNLRRWISTSETAVVAVVGSFGHTSLLFDFRTGRRVCLGCFWTFEANFSIFETVIVAVVGVLDERRPPLRCSRRSSCLFWAFLDLWGQLFDFRDGRRGCRGFSGRTTSPFRCSRRSSLFWAILYLRRWFFDFWCFEFISNPRGNTSPTFGRFSP